MPIEHIGNVFVEKGQRHLPGHQLGALPLAGHIYDNIAVDNGPITLIIKSYLEQNE